MSVSPLASEVSDYTLEEIVQSGLCIGCGLCRAAFPDAVVIADAEDGLQRPRALRVLDESERTRLNVLCPGVRVAFPMAEGGVDPTWGPYNRIAFGYASDPAIRYRASSGGAITALALHILDTGQADFIMHLRADPKRPMLSLATRSYAADEVIAASGSRYSASAPLLPVMDVLDEGRPFAVVGKPCDITGLANLGRFDHRVDALCRFRLTFFCGGVSELWKYRELLEAWNFDEKELSEFRFRGNGCPGPTVAVTRDGRRQEVPYWDVWASEETWRVFHRCKICPDAIGLSADLAALDVWDGASPICEDEGWNAVVIRTARGRALMDQAVATGRFTIDRDWTVADLERSQPHQSRKRRAALARFAAMREAGVPFPRSDDPGLASISFDPMSERYRSEYEGMTRRLRTGVHRRKD